MKALTSLAAALALALPAMTVQANELAGIKLGMSLAEAKSSLASSVKKMKIYPITSGENKTEVGFIGLDEASLDSLIAYQGDTGRVWYIYRKQERIPNTQGFTPETLKKSLNEKYGKYSNTNDYGGTAVMNWNFDHNSRLVNGDSDEYRWCVPSSSDSNSISISGNYRDFSFWIPNKIMEKCGVSYQALWGTSAGLVESLTLVVIDHAPLRKSILQQQARKQAEQEQKVKQQSGIKPSL